MPYIKEEERFDWLYHKGLSSLLKNVDERTKAGDLNYIITMILKRAVGKRLSYKGLNEILGVLTCASKEFYRRVVAPYEDQKIKETGDVELYDPSEEE